MSSFRYQVVVQWSSRRNQYEAYAPTIVHHARTFDPGHPCLGLASDPGTALTMCMEFANKYFERLRELAILPPPPDVGGADPVYVSLDDDVVDERHHGVL